MKKILIALVFVCLLCALFSVSAFATETDAAAAANTESTKTVINVAGVTNADEELYTLADAIAYANNEGISEYTLKLTENITVAAQISVDVKVNMTIDLCGYTLTYEQSSDMLVVKKSDSIISFVTSLENGKINSTKKSLVQAKSKGNVITVNFGSEDTKPLTVQANMLFVAEYKFGETSVANINIYGGSYSLLNGLYQATSHETGGVKYGAKYDVKAYNANFTFNSRIMFHNDACLGHNSESLLELTGCTLTVKNSDNYISVLNRSTHPYAGIIKMTDCDLTRFKFDNSSKEKLLEEGNYHSCSNHYNSSLFHKISLL